MFSRAARSTAPILASNSDAKVGDASDARGADVDEVGAGEDDEGIDGALPGVDGNWEGVLGTAGEAERSLAGVKGACVAGRGRVGLEG